MTDRPLPEGGVAFGVARTIDMAQLLDDVATTRTHVGVIRAQVADISMALGSEANGHGIRGRLRKLEDRHTFNRGAMFALHGIWTLLMLAAGWLLAHWSQVLTALGSNH